ncbi:MAG: hypothetical protein ACRDL1_12485 [Solirubrobacterales bacterium]
MSPGLPVIGLGALFCVISALAAPVVELGRVARGQSSVASWMRVGRQFALAVAMIVAFVLTLWLVYALVTGSGVAGLSPGGAVALPSVLIGMSVGLLAALLAGAKGMELAMRTRLPHPPPLAVPARMPRRRSLLQGAGVLAAVWFPLLGFGADGLSSDGVVSRGPVPAVERSASAEVAGAVSARKRVADSAGDEPVPDGSSPASSSGGEGDGAVGPSSLPGDELELAAEYEAAPEGDTGGSGRVPRTGGVAISSETGGNGPVPRTGGVAAPSK